MSVSAAKSRVAQAQIYLESRRYEEIDLVLDTATGFLRDLPDHETAAIRGEIAALRATATEAAAAERYGTKIRAAERELRVARSDADSGYIVASGILERIDKALGYVDDVPDAVKASVVADAAELRARLAPAEPAPVAPVAAAPVAGPTDEEARRLSMARMTIMGARNNVDSRRYDEVEGKLQEADDLLEPVGDGHKAAFLAEIHELRVAVSEAIVAERYGTKIRAAERELRVARSDADSGNVVASGILYRLDRAQEYLDGVPEAGRARLDAEAEELRARLRGEAPPPPSPAPAAAAPVSSEPSATDAMNISRARGVIIGARARAESRRTDGIEETLQEAIALLAPVPESFTAQLRAEIDEIRAMAFEADNAENIRRITSELDRHFSQAEVRESWRLGDSARAIPYLTDRLVADDVRTILPPDVLTQYRDRLADAITARARIVRDTAIERATPVMIELEEDLRTDPFGGLAQDEAYRAATRLRSLKDRVLGELSSAPGDDPGVLTIMARLAATDQIIARADAAWALANVEAAVTNRWRTIRDSIEGWESEAAPGVTVRVEAPKLPQTEQAKRELWFWLGDADAARVRDENVGSAVISAAYRSAQDAYDGVTAKLNLAYVHALDEAEKLPSPTLEREMDVLSHFSSMVDSVFVNTRYHDGLIVRVEELQRRWRADYDAMMQARKELYDRLSVEADAAWPGIVAATGATDEFATGKTVLLSGVFNRAGWEFNGYGFCMRLNGVPVGGRYEPHVLQALEHAWYELKLDVNDRITWDVIGVVEGPGKIAERTEVTLRDRGTGLEIGTLEEWPAVDCVQLRIIALHAGPVAVGP